MAAAKPQTPLNPKQQRDLRVALARRVHKVAETTQVLIDSGYFDDSHPEQSAQGSLDKVAIESAQQNLQAVKQAWPAAFVRQFVDEGPTLQLLTQGLALNRLVVEVAELIVMDDAIRADGAVRFGLTESESIQLALDIVQRGKR